MGQWGEAGKGAAGGAATGAAIGSVAGPYGTAIGAGVGALAGGLLGYFSGDNGEEERRRQQKAIEEYRNNVLARDVPTISATTSDMSNMRANQLGLVQRLEALASGKGPSIADAQLKQSVDRNTSLQQSIAKSGRGNATLANIVAANNSSNFGQAAAQTGVYARLAEQQAADQALGGALQTIRGQDEENSRFNALQRNYAAQANLEAKLRMLGLNDEAILRLMQENRLQMTPAGTPTTGDQLLAGGVGSLGAWASNQRATPNVIAAQSGGNSGGLKALSTGYSPYGIGSRV